MLCTKIYNINHFGERTAAVVASVIPDMLAITLEGGILSRRV